MPYSLNLHLPRLRMQAVEHVWSGWSIRKAARHIGVHPSTVLRWVRRAPPYHARVLPTASSRPQRHPRQLPAHIIRAIIRVRQRHRRCAEIVHRELAAQNITVSLSSVKRTLQRQGLLRPRSPWKRFHRSLPRPLAMAPGDLIQLDTIHVVPLQGPRFYVYTLVDLHSRWAYAAAVTRITARASLRFVCRAQQRAAFSFRMLQSDHGSEFSTWFTEHVRVRGMLHRHSRVRRCNDNGHIERFNRTVQDECLRDVPETVQAYHHALRTYLPYYNGERLHLGINCQTPLQVLRSH